MAERSSAATASVFDEAVPHSLDARAQTLRWSAVAAGLAVGSYLLARYIGIGPTQGPWAYWPITGLLCGILFRRPVREWPYIVVAAVAAQLGTIYLIRGNLAGGATALGAGAGAAQAILGAWLLRRQSRGASPLESARVLARFVAVGVCLVPLAISPVSAAAYSVGLGIPFRAAWGPLFVGNSLSMLIFAPLTMQRWIHPVGWRPWRAGRSESLACLTTLVLIGVIAFSGGPFWLKYVALPYAVFPVLAWAAMRSGPRWTAVQIVTFSTIAAWNTARGNGPFVQPGVSLAGSVFQFEMFIAFVAFTGLLLSAVTEERHRSFIRTAMAESIRSAFFESSRAVIALKDVQGRYLMVNRAAEDAYGVSRERLIGRDPADFLNAESARVVAAHDARTLEKGEPLVFDETLGDGTRERHFTMTRFPVRDTAGAIRYLGMIGIDETVERELSARLQRAQRVELVGQMAAGLAHDINNLLFVLVANAEHLRESGSPTAADREILDEMTDAGAKATRLTARLLSLGKGKTVSNASVNVDDALREMEPLLKAMVRGRIDLTVVPGAPGATVVTDPTAIGQIVLNLVSNSRDAITGDGRIAIASEVVAAGTTGPTGDGGRTLRLRVSDTGSGMDATTKARVFEPFFTTKGNARGTGLGLYSAFVLAQQAGGSIQVESEPGAGTTVTVDLPIRAE